MKYFICTACIVMTVLTVLSFLPVNGEEKIYTDTVRLHVVANSDSEDDQELKLKVRDAVIEKLSESFKSMSREEAEKYIGDNKDSLLETAEKTVIENGYDYPVNIEMGYESYPTRYYENYALPEGTYTSLRIIIGDGSGHNWWCVLYPPLCLNAGKEESEEYFIEAGFTGEQYRMIKNESGVRYKVRFRVLEILSEVFGK